MKPAEPSSLARPVAGYITFATLAIIGCATDLLTKQAMFNWRGFPDRHVSNVHWLWQPYIGIETSLNPGALFGFGAGHSHWFAALSVVAIVGIGLWMTLGRASYDRWLTVALGLVLGGICGNLYDRLGLWHLPNTLAGDRHNVRDWILFQYPAPWQNWELVPWPNFNIADSCLVIGAAILIVHAFLQPVKDQEQPAPAK